MPFFQNPSDFFPNSAIFSCQNSNLNLFGENPRAYNLQLFYFVFMLCFLEFCCCTAGLCVPYNIIT